MKRKVLFVITKSNWGGAQRYVYDIATSLPKEEFEVTVGLGGTGTKYAGTGLLDERLQEAGIRTIQISAFMRDIALRQEIRAFTELLCLFREERPQVVHLNSSKAGGLGALAARLAGIPSIVFTSHGLPHEEDRNSLARLSIFLITWITFLLATRVIVITKNHFKKVSKLPFCKSKIRLIFNGLSPVVFLSRNESRKILETDEKIFQEHNTIWIGAIAEYTKNKGLEYLIRASGTLKRQNKYFLLLLLGDGEERAFLERTIAEEDVSDRVKLLGFVPEAYRYIPAFDIIVLPSVKEGLPYALLEAGQAGVPVIASEVGGVGDIVENTYSGLLCEPKDPKCLAEKLLLLIENKEIRSTLGTNLKKKVLDEFSLELILAQTIAAYSPKS